MSKTTIVLAVIALLGGAAHALAQEAEQRPAPRDLWSRSAYEALLAERGQAAALAVVPESEPNDDYTTADAVAAGDQGTGAIDPAGDWDWWSISLTAGDAISFDVDANQVGSDLDPILELLASDGVTSLAFNDDSDGLDSRIDYVVSTTGTYYLAITDYCTYFGCGDEGGPSYTYTISFNAIEPGPGDPTTEIASALASPFGLATGANGDFYVLELQSEEVLRITPSGTQATFASVVSPWGHPAFDAFGNLLVPSDQGTVYRVTPAGTVSPFITDVTFPFYVATAPDGSIWISDIDDGEIRYYEPDGTFDGAIDLTAVGGAGPIGFSPDGVLHFANGPDLYRYEEGSSQAIVTGQETMFGFSFDVDGNIYVSSPNTSTVILFGPTGTTLADPFSLSVDASLSNAFGRAADGSWNARLFATDINSGTLVEFNPDGVMADGAPMGLSLDMISIDASADELLGVSGSLSDAEMDFLDWMGNGNGAYDVGDFRALLIERGTVTTSLSPAIQALLKAADAAGNRR